MKQLISIALLFLTTLGSTESEARQARQISPSIIDDSIVQTMRDWVQTSVIILSIKAQNDKHLSVNTNTINTLDRQWTGEINAASQPLIAATLNSPASIYLTQVQAQSLGLYTEIFVTDRFGLNVGQSSITSDYWQGDEAKFQQSFEKGKDGLLIDEAEYSDSTGTWRSQVSFTIVNEQNVPIGAVTFEVNLTELQRRQNLKK